MVKKQERLGQREKKARQWRFYCILNFHFKVTEIPDWLATCQSFNKKSQS